MNGWSLPLFPVDNSSASVTMTVWVGVLVVVFFNLRFGWTLSGLVVPGYLVPLLLVKPISVGIILSEAIATYLIVRMLSDHGQRLSFWSSFFGRDRFLLIVLVSILVRAAADGWWLPLVGQWLNQEYGFQLDYRNDLHSYGLIVVALIANYFWKPRLLSGLITGSTTVFATYALVRFVVLGYTNFSLSALHYMYEDISTSLLASPKAYVAVVVTAWLASWLNLRYSWDFNGILLPALLGLLWHDPAKIGITVLEALWILVLAKAILRLPLWKRTTVEGGRKLLLFFSIAATHRLAIAHLLPLWSDVQVTDAYGFGYLLTTLIAMRSHEKKIPVRVIRATLQTSMLGAVLASVIGFALSHPSLDDLLSNRHDATTTRRAEPLDSPRSLRDILDEQHVRLYGAKVPNSYQSALPHELQRFRRAVANCLDYRASRQSDQLQSAAEQLAEIGYELNVVEQRYLVMRDAGPSRGWGTFVLDLDRYQGLLIEVPAPLDEWATIESGYLAFMRLGSHAMAIAGSWRGSNSDRSSDMLCQRNTFLATFHRLVAADNVLQVRGWTAAMLSQATTLPRDAQQDSSAALRSQLFVRRALPPDLNLAILRQIVSDIDIHWQDTPWQNALRDQTVKGFGELILSEYDRRRLRNQMGMIATTKPIVAASQSGVFREWLQERYDDLARVGSDLYVPPLVEEMIFFDEEVVRPLIQLARECPSLDSMSKPQLERADGIAVAAENFGYRLTLFQDSTANGEYFVLHEPDPARYWGTFVFRTGIDSPYLVEVPRPLYEMHTYQFGVATFEQLGAGTLLIAGAHPYANPDGSADLTRLANKVNAMQLVRQVLLRELPAQPMLLVQIRAVRAPIDADLVVATDDGSSRREHLTPLVSHLMDQFTAYGLQTRLVDGSALTAGYELGILLQASSLNHSESKEMVSVWLSPTLRRQFRDSSQRTMLTAQFAAVGIETVEGELFEMLGRFGGDVATERLPDEVRHMVRAFRANNDIMHLYRLTQAYPHMTLVRVLDTATQQSFLLVAPTASVVPTIFNVDGAINEAELTIDQLDADAIRQFARGRSAVLEIRRSP
jgi:hypothetical protein